MKPVDITATSKRKVDSDEHETTLCFPDEDNNSVLNFTKLNQVGGSQLVSPPRKRTRLSDVTSLNMSVKSMRRMSRFMTADALSVLTTPTIHKMKSNVSSFRLDADSTPTSILKVKQLMKEIPSVVESDKMLDVSLSLDKTPTMMRSRDSTPTKSLRFKEPRKLQSDLVADENQVPREESQLSNDTNDSFFSLGSQMDVDSPRVVPREVADSPLVTASFPNRTSGSSRDRTPAPTSALAEQPGPLSPSIRAKLDEVVEAAENKLKNKEEMVRSASKTSATQSRIDTSVEPSGLLGVKDVVVNLEEESQDSDASMRGKVFQRWVGENQEEEEQKSEEVYDIEDNDVEEDEDEKYYENRTFERKVCDIIIGCGIRHVILSFVI